MKYHISKAIQISAYNAKKFSIIEETISPIEKDEIIIKIKYVPLIHYDLMTMSGVTGKELPYIPCVEMSGVIEDAFDKDLIGKKVAATSLKIGALRSKIKMKKDNAVFLNENTDLVKGCIMSCNPLTALGCVDMAIELGAKAFAVTAGNSNCSMQIYKVAEAKGLTCIPIVRSEKRVNELKEIGFKNVVDSSSENFVKELNELMIKLDASVIFECLSGSIVGKVLKALPKYGTLVNFGTQTHLPMSDIDATDFRWGFKKMTSFLVGPWVDEKIKQGKFDEQKNFIRDYPKIFESEPGKLFSYEKLTEAVEYAEGKSDASKVVIDISNLN